MVLYYNLLLTNTQTLALIVQDITISGSSTYTGTEKTATITPSTGTAPSYVASPTLVNAGTYTSANFTFTPAPGYSIGTISGSYVINPATLTGTVSSVSTTYDNTSKTASISAINGSYTGTTTVSRTSVGTSSTTITGSGNYTGTLTATVTIAARVITLTSSGATSFAYTGSARTVGYSINNDVAGGCCVSLAGITATNAGSYTATLTALTNYSLGSPSSFGWTITNGTMALTVIGGFLSATQYQLTYTLTNGPSSVAVLEYSGTSGTTSTTVIKNTATNSNKIWTNATRTITITIASQANWNAFSTTFSQVYNPNPPV